MAFAADPISMAKLYRTYESQMADQVLPGQAVVWLVRAVKELEAPGGYAPLQLPTLTVANFAAANAHLRGETLHGDFVAGRFVFSICLDQPGKNLPAALLAVFSTPATSPDVLDVAILRVTNRWQIYNGQNSCLSPQQIKSLQLPPRAEALLLEVADAVAAAKLRTTAA